MYYYFSADFLSAIKINGIFKCKLSKDHNPFLLCDSQVFEGYNQIFVELCPLNGKEYPISFILDQDFLSNPPKSITVVDLKGGYFIKFLDLCRLSPFEVVAQRKFPFAIATVFKENGLKLSIETANDFYVENLSFDCANAQITNFLLNANNLIAVNFKTDRNILYCYLVDKKITKVFCKDVDSFSLDDGFSTTQIFEDIRGHKVVCDWNIQDNAMKVVNKKITYQKDFQLQKASSKIIGYAFLEELLVGGEINDFLCEQMQDKTPYFKQFFLDYLGVFTPPKFRAFDEIALLYKKKDNLYYLDYYKFELENGKIKNIIRSQN